MFKKKKSLFRVEFRVGFCKDLKEMQSFVRKCLVKFLLCIDRYRDLAIGDIKQSIHRFFFEFGNDFGKHRDNDPVSQDDLLLHVSLLNETGIHASNFSRLKMVVASNAWGGFVYDKSKLRQRERSLTLTVPINSTERLFLLGKDFWEIARNLFIRRNNKNDNYCASSLKKGHPISETQGDSQFSVIVKVKEIFGSNWAKKCSNALILDTKKKETKINFATLIINRFLALKRILDDNESAKRIKQAQIDIKLNTKPTIYDVCGDEETIQNYLNFFSEEKKQEYQEKINGTYNESSKRIVNNPPP